MAFIDRFRQRLRGTPGFAGGTLEEQLARAAGETGDVNAPRVNPTDAALGGAARPRIVNSAVPADIAPPPVPPQQTRVPVDSAPPPTAAMADWRTGRPRESFYRDQGDTQGLYDAYQNWNPSGGKRGFKNALKAGALTAAMAAQNTDNPLAIATAFGVGAGGGAVNPNFKNRLVRNFKLQQVGGELGQGLKLEKDRAIIEQGQMVPFQLPDGTYTQVPAKSAAVLASRQQGQANVLSERKRNLNARVKRWEGMAGHEAAQDAQRLYNSGAADDDDDLKDEIVRRMGLPVGTRLPNATQGQLAVDDQGNYIVVNRRSGTAAPVSPTAQPAQPATAPQGATLPAAPPARVGSMQRTNEAGRNARTATTQAAITERERIRSGGRGGRGKIDAADRRQGAKVIGSIEEIRKALTDIDTDIARVNATPEGQIESGATETAKNLRLKALGRKRAEIVNSGTAAAAELNALNAGYEAGPGANGYPYYKDRGAQAVATEAPGAAPAAGFKYTEADVRARARKGGKNEDAAVEAARAAKLIQ